MALLSEVESFPVVNWFVFEHPTITHLCCLLICMWSFPCQLTERRMSVQFPFNGLDTKYHFPPKLFDSHILFVIPSIVSCALKCGMGCFSAKQSLSGNSMAPSNTTRRMYFCMCTCIRNTFLHSWYCRFPECVGVAHQGHLDEGAILPIGGCNQVMGEINSWSPGPSTNSVVWWRLAVELPSVVH